MLYVEGRLASNQIACSIESSREVFRLLSALTVQGCSWDTFLRQHEPLCCSGGLSRRISFRERLFYIYSYSTS